ncbi:DUF3231 family protein [Cohnella sp. JJ-181]|uniref:DUF3231 family protein n=1 Tax=Cohnella rhizoplanae TaxID=2974897 RepID=UPI0022FF4FF8|nr:DUF3231 family protein [Cohnella sp. JJ-181]CAI6035160.1 hypothetical protein COHCIP112018_00865 [Cohnella sp. JJ-181]
MEPIRNIPLTAPEIANLWSAYQGDTMATCVLSHFADTVEDTQIKDLVLYCLEISERHVQWLSEFFQAEEIPVPIAFTNEDVTRGAPRLYSDEICIGYIMNFGKQGMMIYSMAIPVSSRKDVRDYLTGCMESSAEITNRAIDLMESKGIYIRAPKIPIPDSPEFVHKESYFFAVFGDKRPVNGPEIAHLYANVMTNLLGKALIQGFAQVSRTEDVRDWMLRGRDIASKHVDVFSSILRDDNLPAPNYWDDGVTTSTVAPFSEKLMMFHIAGLNVASAANYGVAAPNSPRRDLVATYVRLLGEIGKYAEDGAEIMLKHHRMEKVPGAVDRDAIVASK